MKEVAALTGGRGMIGRRIAARLLQAGYHVRILTRRTESPLADAEIVCGTITDREAVRRLLAGARAMFHCAGEIRNPGLMEDVNVRGTENVLEASREARPEYFCHLSSVGVIGRVDGPRATEATPTHPQNHYEHTKLRAEQRVANGIPGAHITILRPTNVVAGENPGVLRFLLRRSAPDALKLLLKGGECAHIVHAEDIVDAAMHRIALRTETVETFLVSTDHEPCGTYAEIWALAAGDDPSNCRRPFPHLPMSILSFVRRMLRGSTNRGDLRYSSEALRATGFQFRLGIRGAVAQLTGGKP